MNARTIYGLYSGRALQRARRNGHDVTTDDAVVADIAFRVDEDGEIIAQRRTRILQRNRLRLLEHRAQQT